MDQISQTPTPETTCQCLKADYKSAFEKLKNLNVRYCSCNNKKRGKKIKDEMIEAGRQLVQIAEMLSTQNREYTIIALRKDPQYDGHEPTCYELAIHYVGKDGDKNSGAFKFKKKWLKIREGIDSSENEKDAFDLFMKKPTFAEKLVAFIRLGKLDAYWKNHVEDLEAK
jgi:hypothetical protein